MSNNVVCVAKQTANTRATSLCIICSLGCAMTMMMMMIRVLHSHVLVSKVYSDSASRVGVQRLIERSGVMSSDISSEST